MARVRVAWASSASTAVGTGRTRMRRHVRAFAYRRSPHRARPGVARKKFGGWTRRAAIAYRRRREVDAQNRAACEALRSHGAELLQSGGNRLPARSAGAPVRERRVARTFHRASGGNACRLEPAARSFSRTPLSSLSPASEAARAICQYAVGACPDMRLKASLIGHNDSDSKTC